MSPSRLLRVWCGVLGAKTRKLDLIGVLGTVKGSCSNKNACSHKSGQRLSRCLETQSETEPG